MPVVTCDEIAATIDNGWWQMYAQSSAIYACEYCPTRPAAGDNVDIVSDFRASTCMKTLIHIW